MSDPAKSTGRDTPSPRFTLGAMFLFIAVFGCLCGGLVCRRFIGPGPYPPGPVTQYEELPFPWKDHLAAAEKGNVRLSRIEYYRIYGGLSSDHAIRLDYSQEALDFLLQYDGFSQVPPNSRFVFWFWEKMPKSWITRAAATNVDYYASRGWLRGDEGDLYVMMHDKTNNKIYLWYHFNF